MSQMEIFYKRINFRQNRPSDRACGQGLSDRERGLAIDAECLGEFAYLRRDLSHLLDKLSFTTTKRRRPMKSWRCKVSEVLYEAFRKGRRPVSANDIPR